MRHEEDDHQKAIFLWAKQVRLNVLQHRGKQGSKLSDYLYAIPNGGKRNAREAVRLKAQGLMAGVPDMHLPIPASNYHSLYIELKRPVKKGRPKPVLSDLQKQVISRFIASGNACVVCYGFDEAKAAITKYLTHQLTDADLYKTGIA
jgi:hypothetical protein